jgi:cytochrome o ubiquinol oxidase subunit 2
MSEEPATAYLRHMLQSHPSLKRLRTAAILSMPLLLAACDRAVLNPAGDVARQQRDLIYISTGLMLLIIVPVMILTVVVAWRYRKGKGATYDPHFDHSTSLELVIWSAPLLIIIILGALTWSSTHLLDPFRPLSRKAAVLDPNAAAVKPLRVQVVSMDWKWLFIYPEQGIATVNELVLPVDREVRFDITSTNMMSTFYAPTMAGMIYAMPGMQSTLHAVLDRPVSDEGISGMYTGAGFANHRFKLHGVPQSQFDQWVAKAKASGQVLNTPTYLKLVEPTEKHPITYFAASQPDLFRRIVERCVEPGKPCMSELMEHGKGKGHGSGMTPRGNSLPGPGAPEGALQKSPREIDAAPHFTAPQDANSAAGVNAPEDSSDTNMSDLQPRLSPRQAATVRA